MALCVQDVGSRFRSGQLEMFFRPLNINLATRDRRSRRHPVRLFLAVLCAFVGASIFAGAGESKSAHPDLATYIIPSMERAQSDVQLPRQIVREYHVTTPSKISSDSKIIAQMDYAPPPGKYVIQQRMGSVKAEFVVKNVLQRELEISVSNQKLRSAAITHENYDFILLGDDSIDGHTCFVLQMNPKRDQAELIRGRVWVDQQSFLIRRIDGDLVKSPSWWVKAAHVDIRFADFRGVWLQTSWQAVAQVRCFGDQELTSRVLDYAGAPLTAKNLGHASIGSP